MKKLKFFLTYSIIITTLITLFPKQCAAQNNKHAMMGWFDIGYSSFFTKWDSFKNIGSVSCGFGLGYNLTVRNHLIFSVGIEYLSLNSSTSPTDRIIKKTLIDTEGDEYEMIYALKKFVQIDKTHNIFIPVFLGYKTDFNKVNFFFQAGGKIGYMFAATYTSKAASFKTTGIYDHYIDPFENMPNHYFDTKKYNKTEKLNFNKLQAVTSLEFGIEMPSAGAKSAMRISLFADYNLINRQTAKMQHQLSEFIVFKTIPNDIKINNLYNSEYKKSLTTNALFVGVKITLLLNVTKTLCNTY